MVNGNQARAALQKYFPRPFTDLQWEMVAAQGYEQAIVSGERTAESVAEELQALMAAVRENPAGAELSDPGSQTFEPRSWEDMEKWVLARALSAGGPARVSPVPARVGPAPVRVSPPATSSGVTGMGTYATAFPEPPRRRWWLWAALGAVAVAVIVAALLVLLTGGQPTSPTSTSVGSVSDRAGVAATGTTTTEPPATTTSSTTTSTTSSTTTTEVDLTPTYVAQLSGDKAVPAVSTSATGTLTLTVAEDGESVAYVFEVSSLTDLTIARLRTAVAGASGDEIFPLYLGPTIAGAYSGVVAEGSFTAAELLGPLLGKTIADLVALIEAGSVYLNVGTVAHTVGEIRGQLE